MNKYSQNVYKYSTVIMEGKMLVNPFNYLDTFVATNMQGKKAALKKMIILLSEKVIQSRIPTKST